MYEYPLCLPQNNIDRYFFCELQEQFYYKRQKRITKADEESFELYYHLSFQRYKS